MAKRSQQIYNITIADRRTNEFWLNGRGGDRSYRTPSATLFLTIKSEKGQWMEIVPENLFNFEVTFNVHEHELFIICRLPFIHIVAHF